MSPTPDPGIRQGRPLEMQRSATRRRKNGARHSRAKNPDAGGRTNYKRPLMLIPLPPRNWGCSATACPRTTPHKNAQKCPQLRRLGPADATPCNAKAKDRNHSSRPSRHARVTKRTQIAQLCSAIQPQPGNRRPICVYRRSSAAPMVSR